MKKIENIASVVFHHFHDFDKHKSSQGSISAKTFEKFINYLSDEYNLLSADIWMEKFLSNTLSQEDIVITFDDALLCQYDIALPVLEKYNLKAFWFLYSSYLDSNMEKLEIYRYFRNNFFGNVEEFYDSFFTFASRSSLKERIDKSLNNFVPAEYLQEFSLYSDEDRIFRYIRDKVLSENEYFELMDSMIDFYNMDIREVVTKLWITKDEIKNLSNLNHMIGLHSHSHPTDISRYSYEEQLNEYSINLQKLESITDVKIISMSHPCGKYNNDTLQILEKLGIKVGFRADRKNMEIEKKYEMARIDHSLLTDLINDVYA